MQIEQKDLDNLTAQIHIKIDEKDYADKVAQKLQEYKKNLEIPGFRKGKVPMNLIKQRFERALIAQEVNDQMQDALNKYLIGNKIPILGYPIPSETQKEIDWATTKDFEFNYDIGLAPELDIDLSKLEGITDYKITADKKMIDEEVVKIQQQYGSFSDLDEVKKDSFVLGTFINEDEGINSQTTVNMAELTESAQKTLIGKKKGDIVELNSSDLYKDPHTMMHALNISHDKVHGLEVPLKFEVNGVFELKPAEITKELLDKVFGEGNIEDEEGLRKFIKDDIEKQLEQVSDNQLLNDVTVKLLETVEVPLPESFLKRWIEIDSEGKITGEKAEEDFKNAEKGLKYQLIEEAIAKKYGIKVTYDELLALVKDLLKMQMLQYGQQLPDEEQIEEIAKNVLKNEEEVKRLSDQILKKKLVKLYKEQVPVQKKRIGYNKFLDIKNEE